MMALEHRRQKDFFPARGGGTKSGFFQVVAKIIFPELTQQW